MLGIQLKHYLFKPTLIPSLVTLALLCIMISLGFWQLDRAAIKNNIQTLMQNKQDAQAISLLDVTMDKNDWLYQPIYTTGRFDIDYYFFLDNQVHNMVAGYSVFTPLLLPSNKAILVNRGWIASTGDRSKLPDVAVDTRLRRMHGIANKAPSSGLILSENANVYKSQHSVLQYIDLAEIEKEIGYKLMPMILIMDKQKETSLKPLPITINMRAEKHTAYAFQWFGLSLALFVIYIVVNTKNTTKE